MTSATFVAACSATPIPLAAWITKADAVCTDAQELADQEAAPPGLLPGDPLRRAAKHSRNELDGLEKLDRPDERRTAVDEYLRTFRRRIDLLELYADEVDKTPTSAPAPPVDDLTSVTAQVLTQAVALGLERCGAGVDADLGPGAPTTTLPGDTTPVPTAVGGHPEDEETTEDLPG